MNLCLVCGTQCSVTPAKDDSYVYRCSLCGDYVVSHETQAAHPGGFGLQDTTKIHAMGALRQRKEDGLAPYPVSGVRSFDILIAGHPIPRDAIDMMDLVLLYVAKNALLTGDLGVPLNHDALYPIAFARSSQAFVHLVHEIRAAGLARTDDRGNNRYWLSPAGWQRVREVKKESRVGNKAFVAMAFDAQLNSAYADGIVPGLSISGYDPVRVDQVHQDGKICDYILGQIRASRLVVSDFTMQKHGVYYEAGFAQGLGIPVIWTCHEDHMKGLHFDTRQYVHLVWKTPQELRDLLTNRVKALYPL